MKLAGRHQFWMRHLPNSAEGLWDWLLAQDSATRLDLLAYCAGCSVNAVRKRHERADTDRLAHADILVSALGLDMTQWWQPTAAGYFRHVPKARILEAVAEGVTPEAADNLAKLKKEALAAEAEQRLAGTGWLPAILRRPDPVAAEPVPEMLAAERAGKADSETGLGGVRRGRLFLVVWPEAEPARGCSPAIIFARASSRRRGRGFLVQNSRILHRPLSVVLK